MIDNKIIKINGINISNTEKFVLIAGPCVIESYDLCAETCEKLKNKCLELNIPFIFKSSYLKDNRTSINSFTGLGIEEGLNILSKIKKEYNVPIITDIHQINEIESASEVADILQIPAFLSRQTSLIIAAAKTKKIINVKKAQFMAPEDMENIIKKINSCENDNILLTERGSCFGYHNLVVDFRGMLIMKKTKYPVIYDVTHSLQQPSINNVSGGTPEYVIDMAKAGLALGLAGLFIETHPDPKQAKSDANSMIQLDLFINNLNKLKAIDEVVKNGC